VPTSQYYGYDFKSSQPAVRANLKIPVNGSLDLNAIDAWLEGPFAADKAELAEIGRPGGETPADKAAAVMNRAFVLYGEILRAASIPVFARGQVLGTGTDGSAPGQVAVNFLLPVVDNVPVSLFEGVLKEALRLVMGPLSSPSEAGAARDFLVELDRNVVKPLGSAVPFNGTTIQVCRVIFEQGLPFRHIGNGMFRIGWGSRSQMFQGASAQVDSAIGARICHNKLLSSRVLSGAGYPAAENATVKSADEAVAAARAMGWPVVVKPVDRERSEGVTTNIRSETATRLAYDHARELSEDILVERHVPGVVHRIMVAGGQIVYVVKRLPKGVRGDGRNAISALVHAAELERLRLPPWKQLKSFELDELASACLKEQGYSHQSVPEEGAWVSLRPLAAGAWGGGVEDMTKTTHPDNLALALDVARLLGMTSVGVDIITPDITRPWHEVGAIVNEVNFGPQFSTAKREVYAERFVAALASGGGRVPVHLVTGSGDLLTAARTMKKRLKGKGRNCHLTTATRTEDASGREVPMRQAALFERSIALLMRPEVHELIIAASPREVFEKGLPADQLANVWVEESDEARAKALSDEIGRRFPVKSLRRSAS